MISMSKNITLETVECWDLGAATVRLFWLVDFANVGTLPFNQCSSRTKLLPVIIMLSSCLLIFRCRLDCRFVRMCWRVSL